MLFRLDGPIMNTTFAKRFRKFLHPYVHNKVNSLRSFKLCSISELKRKVSDLLGTLNYFQLEDFLIEVRR